MENIHNLRIVKNKIVPLLLAGSLTLSLTGCSGEVDLSSVSASWIVSVDEVKDLTLIDELMENGRIKLVDELTLVEAVDRLEEYMNIVDMINSIELEDVTSLEPLSDDSKKGLSELSIEDVEELVEDAKLSGKKLSLDEMERKINAHKKLTYLCEYCKEWIKRYGKSVSLDFMMLAVKASVASELGVDVDNYSSIVIPPFRGFDADGPSDLNIIVGDVYYRIPRSEGEIINTVDYIYSVQMYNESDSTAFATYRKAINYAKTTLASGCDLENDKLVAQNDASYIKKYQK